jgi:galactosylceramidase
MNALRSCRLLDPKAILPLVILYSCAIVCSTPTLWAQQTEIVLDGNSTGRMFDGLGALSAGASSRLLIDYPEPQRSQILDYLFKPAYGAVLQHLKVEIGADVNSTDGSEPSFMRTPSDYDSSRGYEWWLMEQAKKRNPDIILEVLPWGAPGWVGKDSLYTPAMADYVARFIEAARKDHHLEIKYAGIWNEKVFDATYVKELAQQLKAHHLATKIVCCDEFSGEGDGQWAIADAILKDPTLADAVSVIGVHYPLVNGKITTTDTARETGKPLWSSEDQPNSGSGPFLSRDWPVGGRILAHLYNQNSLE